MTDLHVDLIEPHFDTRGNSNYHPCRFGLHLCGQTVWQFDADLMPQPYTALNIPAKDEAEARAMFAAAKEAASCSEQEADYCCDLNIGGDHVDDFWTNRQLLPALIAAAKP
jgi:hypothetical protein